MRQDSENGKDDELGRPSSSAPVLPGAPGLVDRLFSESGACSWGLSQDHFQSAIERSCRRHFAAAAPSARKLEEYLGTLHLKDLALACACADGCAKAWEHFVATYRSYLRAAAGAILRCSAASPAACELADSVFADLYGLSEQKGAERSLFRYFHGRSSLKTWLRAILSQRHVDAIRAARRFTNLEDDDSAAPGKSQITRGASRIESPPDPHRDRYVALVSGALEVALGLLDARDRQRLRMYYAEQQTLAEIGRALGEHESSVSRNLERIRRDLRRDVEAALRKGRLPGNGASPEPSLSEEQIALCFQYASEDAPIDLEKLFPRPAQQPAKTTRQQS
jgi:RNA polymerase sigma-70 factor